MNLIVGATGYLGGMITQRLLLRGEEVRVVVRAESDRMPLVRAGAQPVYADLKEPSSLRAACEGIDLVVTTANSAQRGGDDTAEAVDLAGNQNLIEAAQAAGVRHFIFVSAFGADPSHPVPFLQAKARTEETLRASGLTYTILAPHVFMDVWIPIVVGSAIQEGRPVCLIGSGERRHSFIAVDDVAAFAVAAVHNQSALNQKIALGGPEAVSWRDILIVTEKQLQAPIPFQSVPVGQPLPQLPDLITALLTGMEMADVVIDMESVARTFGVQQTTVAQYISRVFPAGR